MLIGKAFHPEGPWLRLDVKKGDAYTYSPNFDIHKFENVHVEVNFVPSRIIPTVQSTLDQSGFGTVKQGALVPNVRFTFAVRRGKAHKQFKQIKQLHRLMGFQPHGDDDDSVEDDVYCIAHNFERKYAETNIQHGAIEGVPFTFCFLDRGRNWVHAYASYYPTFQADVQEDFDFFKSLSWDPGSDDDAYVIE